MAFRGIAETNQRRLDEHVRKEIQDLVKRGNITLEEYCELRGNSWELEHVVTALSDEAFAEYAKIMLDNCHFNNSRPFASYNEAVMGMTAPELLKRFNRLRKVSP